MTTKTATIEVHTEPTRASVQPRTVVVPTGVPVNKHHNDDGSITLYARGLKIFRTLATEGDDAADEDYDADEAVAKFCRKWFGRNREPVFGKTTYGHNWKKKVATPAEETPAPKAKRVRRSRAKKSDTLTQAVEKDMANLGL